MGLGNRTPACLRTCTPLRRKKILLSSTFSNKNQFGMANTINVPRGHLIMGLCLPLAVLVGYFLAQPLESGSFAVVLLVLSVLSVPLFIKWHHPLLILCWNVYANPLFLPGRP